MRNPIGATSAIPWVVVCSLVACTPTPSATPIDPDPPVVTTTESAPPEVESGHPDAHEAIAKTLSTLEDTGLATSGTYRITAPLAETPDRGPKERAARKATPLALLADLFGDSKVCSLPKKLRKKLKKSQEKKPEDALPGEVFEGIQDIKDIEAAHFTGVNFPYVIHLLQFSTTKPADGFEFDPEKSPKVDSAPTISNLDIRRIQAPDTANMFYELDCSGYLTASLKVKAGAGVANVQAEAAAKMSTSASMTAVRVIVASPIGLALRESAYVSSKRLPPLTRFGVLFSLADKARDQGEDDYVVAPKYIQIVATSTQRSRSMQGKMDVSASGAGGAGIVSAEGSTQSGFSISNGVSYDKFSVLYLDPPDAVLQGVVAQQVKTVRETVRRLASESSLGLEFNTIDDDFVFHPVLPSTVCLLDWQLGDAANVTAGLGKVNPTMTDSDNDGVFMCTFSLSLSQTGIAAAQTGTLHAHFADLALKMPMPRLPTP